jgi:indolepyruvate ferredoxin oxidoreductase beta subunit
MDDTVTLPVAAPVFQSQAKRAKRILIGTVGGQGGGVLSDWLVHGLLNAGWRATSIGLLGMSQRAGTVTYYCEAIAGEGRMPIPAVFATPGDVDLLIGQELLELGRLVFGGFASPDCSIIGNSARYLTTIEKMPAEGGVFDSSVIARAVEALAPGRHYVVDAQRLVVEAGLNLLTSNALLLGAAIASPAFDLPRDSFHEAIRESEVNVKANIAAFDLGYNRVKDGTLPRMMVEGHTVQDGTELARQRRGRLSHSQRGHYDRLLAQSVAQYGEQLHLVLAEALYRLIDYQDVAYAEEYLARLDRMAAHHGANDPELLAAYAQHLSNMMTYEDVARVAQLKTRPERFARIKRDFGVTNQRYVVTDFLVPDMEQMLGGLPGPVASFLERTGRMVKRDFDQLKFPMRVKTSSPFGYSLMRSIASLKSVRRRSRRFAEEQALLARWEAAIVKMAALNPRLGVLAADAGRVVKGYGRVRRDALGDFWAYLDEALPRIAQTAKTDQAIDDLGGRALKVIAKEAGSQAALRAFLDAELPQSVA